MKKISNIVKGIVGRLPVKNQQQRFEKISWFNEKILKHQNDESLKCIVLSGLTIFYQRPYELMHTYKELFEKQIYKFPAFGTPLILDCGANIGLSVLYFKAIYPDATIIAFEPDENNFLLLKKNIETNKLANVTLNNSAIWIHNNSISFLSSASEASHIANTSDKKSIQVKSKRLKDILVQYERIDFLKIDIEGAELEVMKDCSEDLNNVQNLFLEYHAKTNETRKLKDITSIIEAAGFSVYIQNAADLLAHPYLNKSLDSIYDVQLNIFCYR